MAERLRPAFEDEIEYRKSAPLEECKRPDRRQARMRRKLQPAPRGARNSAIAEAAKRFSVSQSYVRKACEFAAQMSALPEWPEALAVIKRRIGGWGITGILNRLSRRLSRLEQIEKAILGREAN